MCLRIAGERMAPHARRDPATIVDDNFSITWKWRCTFCGYGYRTTERYGYDSSVVLIRSLAIISGLPEKDEEQLRSIAWDMMQSDVRKKVLDAERKTRADTTQKAIWKGEGSRSRAKKWPASVVGTIPGYKRYLKNYIGQSLDRAMAPKSGKKPRGPRRDFFGEARLRKRNLAENPKAQPDTDPGAIGRGSGSPGGCVPTGKADGSVAGTGSGKAGHGGSNGNSHVDYDEARAVLDELIRPGRTRPATDY